MFNLWRIKSSNHQRLEEFLNQNISRKLLLSLIFGPFICFDVPTLLLISNQEMQSEKSKKKFRLNIFHSTALWKFPSSQDKRAETSKIFMYPILYIIPKYYTYQNLQRIWQKRPKPKIWRGEAAQWLFTQLIEKLKS